MKKVNTSPISGAQELLPEVQTTFDNLKTKISHTYSAHGFFNIETPTIERLDILLAKAGGDTEKQIYNVSKTSEKIEHASEGLRFDHTVPLARYVVEHESNLNFPFKVQQIGQSYRGERAQKGRFREFYQCDIDIIGRGKLNLAADADVISTLLDAFKAFGLKTPVLARISNRKILAGFLEALGLTEKTSEISNIIDHAEKVTEEQTKTALEELKIDKSAVKIILDLINLSGPRAEVVTKLNNLEIDNETFISGVTELDQILGYLECMGLRNNITADLKIVRGLDYYTGTVFEFILPEYKNIGSVCGGGRYENLTAHFSDKTFPGVGGSIGLTRLFYVLTENNLLKSSSDSLLDYAVIPVSENEAEYAFMVADLIREQDRSASLVLSDKKLGDKITYATKIARNGIVIGEEETATGNLVIKDFSTGETTDLNLGPSLLGTPDPVKEIKEPEGTEEPKETEETPEEEPKDETPTSNPDDFWSDEGKALF